MKKKIWIIIILIIGFIIIFFIKNKVNLANNIFDDLLIFGMWNENNTYFLDTNKNSNVQVNLYSTIKGGNNMRKKIAPGTKGEFVIILKKDEELNCKVIFTSITKKPKNLEFKLNDKKYNTLNEMEKEINEILKENNRVTINWEWKYDVNDKKDIEDTEDGENLKEYIFNMDTIVEEWE